MTWRHKKFALSCLMTFEIYHLPWVCGAKKWISWTENQWFLPMVPFVYYLIQKQALKTDLKGYNKHCIRFWTSFQMQIFLCREGEGNLWGLSDLTASYEQVRVYCIINHYLKLNNLSGTGASWELICINMN